MESIKNSDLKKFVKDFESNPQNKVMENVLSKNELVSSIKVNSRRIYNNHNFDINIKTMTAANQKASGRCWIFAGLNVLREIVAKKCNLNEFELSQSFIAFYDKLEKINYKLESIIELKDKDHDDRTLYTILSEGIQDGGQWDMFVNIVNKYGICPKSVMDETYQTSNTRQSNFVIATAIRKFAARVKYLINSNQENKIKEEKEELLSKLYSFLCMTYSEPVETFDFEYTDKDGVYHLDKDLTPLKFKEKYIGDSLEDYVSIINAPTLDKPFYKTFNVKYVGNVVGGKDIFYLNLPMNEFKELCITQLKNNEVVWFGSDCGKYNNGEGVWDDQSLDYLNTFHIDLDVDKADMLNYKISAMNHAMVITGVNLSSPKYLKWKIENSWGVDSGNKGYFLMSDTWFDKFVYQAVINKKYLSDGQKKMLEEKPIKLEPWDPMGTLAE